MDSTWTPIITFGSSIFGALVGFTGTVYASRMSLRGHLKELERRLADIRQSQLTEVLRKRVETFPKMWSCFYKYIIRWDSDGSPYDVTWISSFLSELHDCNESMGVFLTEPIYTEMRAVRDILYRLKEQTDHHEKVDERDVEEIRDIYFGKNQPGLSTLMKDGLGSYRHAAISVAHDLNETH